MPQNMSDWCSYLDPYFQDWRRLRECLSREAVQKAIERNVRPRLLVIAAAEGLPRRFHQEALVPVFGGKATPQVPDELVRLVCDDILDHCCHQTARSA